MAIWTKQLHVANGVVFKITINMVDFKWHPICH